MPHSLVLNLFPDSPIPPGFLTGQHFHALFLSLVSSVNKRLGDELHANQANKPFTLSPIQVVSGLRTSSDSKLRRERPKVVAERSLRWQYQEAIAPGSPCWWRISLLEDRLFHQLSQLWLNLNPQKPWHLGPADLYITSILGTPQSTQPWANYCPYEQLYEGASRDNRRISLQFFTPTAFRHGKYDSALPTPEAVFGSLLRRWSRYSPIPISSEAIALLHPSAFKIHTERVTDPRQQFQHTGASINPAQQFTGCIGTVTFQVLGDASPEILQQVNALADFALYAGVGRKTPMGMGVTRRVS